MIRLIIVMLICVSASVAAWRVNAAVNKGAEQITIDGGNRGQIHFPHRDHQKRLDDCMVCHNLFAQEKGSIEKAKADGKLAKKQVMTKLCIHCHRAEKKAGKPGGPTSCAKCHKKE